MPRFNRGKLNSLKAKIRSAQAKARANQHRARAALRRVEAEFRRLERQLRQEFNNHRWVITCSACGYTGTSATQLHRCPACGAQ
ncbi:MAG: hypothetical protein AAGA48_28785 [Myxococcota bacterium]